jgi:hypothetical protein
VVRSVEVVAQALSVGGLDCGKCTARTEQGGLPPSAIGPTEGFGSWQPPDDQQVPLESEFQSMVL